VNSDGTSRGYGFVQFEKAEHAAAAIEKLNGSTQKGSEIQVIKHAKRSDREEQVDNYTNLHVKNIPKDFTDAQLKALFAEFGDIQNVKVKEDGSEQGFCKFVRHEDALKAIDALNGKKEINGKFLFVSKHISKAENEQSGKLNPITQQLKETYRSNIFVRNVPKDVTEAQFQEKMGKCGKIMSLKLKDQEQKSSTGEVYVNYQIGYVCYEDVQQAQKCIQLYDQSNCFGYGKKALHIDFWQSRQDLQSQKEEKSVNQVKSVISFIQ